MKLTYKEVEQTYQEALAYPEPDIYKPTGKESPEFWAWLLEFIQPVNKDVS